MMECDQQQEGSFVGAEQELKRVGGKSEGGNEEANLEGHVRCCEESGFDCEGNGKSLKCSEQRRETYINF